MDCKHTGKIYTSRISSEGASKKEFSGTTNRNLLRVLSILKSEKRIDARMIHDKHIAINAAQSIAKLRKLGLELSCWQVANDAGVKWGEYKLSYGDYIKLERWLAKVGDTTSAKPINIACDSHTDNLQ